MNYLVKYPFFGPNRINLLAATNYTRNLIDDTCFMQNHRFNPEDFTRKRKMPFTKLLRFMLSRYKCSTQNALEKFFLSLGEQQFMTQQSFSAARCKIKETAFIELFHLTAKIMYDGFFDTWNGYRVMAIDGSVMALPNVWLLGEIFGRNGVGAVSPAAQGSICYDILNRVVVDALIEPLASNERTLALRHIDNLSLSRKMEKELVIMDRGYPSFEFIEQLKQKGINFIMRVKARFNNEIDLMDSEDKCIVLRHSGHDDIKIRVVKLRLPSNETETLITDLFDEKISVAHFKELYLFRWPVETKYDDIKNKLEIENFSGHSVQAIKQDFFATMYLSNMAMIAWWDAQAKVEQQRADKANKYQYRVNINHEIGVLKDRFILALCIDDPLLRRAEVDSILFLLSKRVCPVIPNRSFPRTRRHTKFRLNAKSNC